MENLTLLFANWFWKTDLRLQIKRGLSNFQNWFPVRLSISLRKLIFSPKQLARLQVFLLKKKLMFYAIFCGQRKSKSKMTKGNVEFNFPLT